LFAGCTRIPTDFEYITVSKASYEKDTDFNGSTIKITDDNEIAQIVVAINFSYSEPAKYFPEYYLDLHYKDSTINLLVRGHYFKIKGKTYRSTKNLSTLLENLNWKNTDHY
jgi:hypothetical protein